MKFVSNTAGKLLAAAALSVFAFGASRKRRSSPFTPRSKPIS